MYKLEHDRDRHGAEKMLRNWATSFTLAMGLNVPETPDISLMGPRSAWGPEQGWKISLEIACVYGARLIWVIEMHDESTRAMTCVKMVFVPAV